MFMRKFLLAALLVGAANVAMAQTVTFGPYDELEEWGDYSGFEVGDEFRMGYHNGGGDCAYDKTCILFFLVYGSFVAAFTRFCRIGRL